ncbi:adenine-specific methyltransferase EcoRI family protein [Lacticaseibacillus paracasei]|uniref:adenine-specific methyltransferase EcoRI family protein n=1 Tax=Lacticaseibacillus paracasei TaxID=1597 RepID=UPI001CDAC328|nr:adenine-specific methyltransferase EcoRI family protein [Lacticaseibacillus paracasei]
MARTKEKLSRAKNVKNDEFYTQWSDIEKEVNAYIEYDKDVFRGLDCIIKVTTQKM